MKNEGQLMNRIKILFDASYDIGQAAALATMQIDGSGILANGARKLAHIDVPSLQSAAAELSAIEQSWASRGPDTSNVYHSRIQKADGNIVFYHSSSCGYDLGTTRAYCEHDVVDISRDKLGGHVKSAEGHAESLRSIGATKWKKDTIVTEFKKVEDPIRGGAVKFTKTLHNCVPLIDQLKNRFAEKLG